MTEALPDPLVAPEVDLRDFPFVPIDAQRLFNSQFHARASDAEWRAGVTLWLKSFHQVPAASLPDDDTALTRLAELGRDVKAWRKIKAVALYGWVKCSDGLLYHPVVAEKALNAWERKKAQRDRTEKARTARMKQRTSQTANAPVTKSVTDSKREGEGEREGERIDNLGGELSAGAGANAVEVIADFDRIRVEVFGDAQARPNPHATDLVHAQRFLAAGASRELIAAVFDEAQRRRHGTGQRPIDGLAYPGFERAIADAVATAARPITPGHATTQPPGRGFIKPRIT